MSKAHLGAKKMLPYYGTYVLGETIGTAYPVYKILKLRQEQMKRANLINGDNYYHRLGMHDAGTLGVGGALSGLAGGLAKEVVDFKNKVIDGNEKVLPVLKDCWKDIGNDIDGLFRGLTHREENGINWLNNGFDINTNTWK